ncbi:MAG: helix-turn-helix transcriptional regulator [Candidatus Nanohalobium sp.]
MRKKIALLALIGTLLISTATATIISEEEITVDLQDNRVTVRMEISELTTDSFNYRTTHPVRELEAAFNGKEKNCMVQDLTVGAEINCDTDLENNFSVKLSYTTSGLVDSLNSVKSFSYSQSIYRPINNYSLKVILPPGTGLVDPSNITTPVVQPQTGKLGNEDGRRFSVKWSRSPELGETIRFQVIFESFKQRAELPAYVPYVLGLLLVSGIGYIVYRRKTEVEASGVLEELGPDEEMVLELLRENEGEMLQKDIVEESDYSKAKISGVIGDLEDKEIVSKEKEGRSNKVSLDNRFKD